MRLRILLLLLTLVACNGTGKKNGQKTAPKKIPPQPTKRSQAAGSPTRAAVPKTTPWVRSSPPFRLVAQPSGAVHIGADGPLHGGLEVYEIADPALLRLLVAADGLDGRALSAACARAITRSPLALKPQLTAPPPDSAPQGLRLLRFLRFSVVDPQQTSRLPLPGLGPGLYLICLRAGGRVAMMPLGLGGPRITLIHSRGRTLALLGQSRRPLPTHALHQITPGRIRERRTERDGVAVWPTPGAAQLIAARMGGGWGLAYLPAPSPPASPTPRMTVLTEAIYPGELLELRIQGPQARSGPLWLIGPDGERRLLRYVGIDPGQPARVRWRAPLALRPGRYQLTADLGQDPGDQLRVPLQVRDGFRAAAIMQTTLTPSRPTAGQPVTLKVALRPAADFTLVAARSSMGPAGERIELDQRTARGVAGRASIELGRWDAGDQLLTLEARLPDGGRVRARHPAWVLPKAGHAVRPDRSVYPPGGPVSCQLVSRHAGAHRLELQLQTAADSQRVIATQQVRVEGRTRAELRPSQAGRMRLRLIAPDGSTSTSGWFLTAGTASRTPVGSQLAVGHASPGAGWPVILGLQQRACHLVVLETDRGSRHQVLVGPGQRQLTGRVPGGLASVRVQLASWTDRWAAPLAVWSDQLQRSKGQLVAPAGFSGLVSWRRLTGAATQPGPVIRRPVSISADSRTANRQLYQLRLRTTQIQAFSALASLSKRDFRKAAQIARRILAAFPQHKLARSILQRARRGMASQGVAAEKTDPLARLRATRIKPSWRKLPLSAVIAELRDAAGVLLELDVRHPHQSVTLSASTAQDADTLLRTLLGRLGLAYRAIPGGFRIHEEVPRLPDRTRQPSARPTPHPVLLTYRPLSTPPPARTVRKQQQLTVPPGGPWEALLWPAGGQPPVQLPIAAAAALEGVLPTFLRPGDRCTVPLNAPAGLRLQTRGKTITLRGASLSISPVRSTTIAATLVAGPRQRQLTVPVLTGADATRQRSGRLHATMALTLDGPGILMLEGDWLAMANRLIRSIPPGCGPRAEVVRQWCKVVATRLCRQHKLALSDFSGLPPLATALPAPKAGTWGSAETTALVHHDLVRLAAWGVAVPPGLTEPVRPVLERLLQDTSRPMSWRAAALMALAAEQLKTRKVGDLEGLEISTCGNLALARLLRAALYTKDRETANALARALHARASKRGRRWGWTTAGRDPDAVTAEVALALLAYNPGHSRAQDAVSGLLRASKPWRGLSLLPILQAILRSLQLRPPAPPGRVTLKINGKARTLTFETGRSRRLQIGPGRTRIQFSGARSLSYAYRASSAGSSALPLLPVRWSAQPAALRIGQTTQVTIDLAGHQSTALRRLEIGLLPGCRVRLAPAPERRVHHTADRLIVLLPAGDAGPVKLALTPGLQGRFLLPGPTMTDLLGRPIAAAPATKVGVRP